jgi:hypothetical protein
MDQIVAFTALIIGTGLIAKVFPKIMTKIFDHYPSISPRRTNLAQKTRYRQELWIRVIKRPPFQCYSLLGAPVVPLTAHP